MLKQLFSHQNKEKHLTRFGTKFHSQEMKIVIFEFDVFFLAPTLWPYGFVSNWNFPKIGNEFKCLMHINMLQSKVFAKFPVLASQRELK